jgi:plastocyanin
MKKIFFIILLMVCLVFALGCQETVVEEKSEKINVEPEEEATSTTKIPVQNDIKIIAYGPEGFNTEEITASKTDSITFVNKNSKGKDISITLQKKNSQKFINTEVIKLGEEHSLNIEEIGTYEFWTLGFANRGKIIIE